MRSTSLFFTVLLCAAGCNGGLGREGVVRSIEECEALYASPYESPDGTPCSGKFNCFVVSECKECPCGHATDCLYYECRCVLGALECEDPSGFLSCGADAGTCGDLPSWDLHDAVDVGPDAAPDPPSSDLVGDAPGPINDLTIAELLDAPDVPAPCPGVGDLTGRTYRFTQLEITAPTDLLNPSWSEDFASDDLVVLLHVVAHDVATGSLLLEIGGGGASFEPGGEAPTALGFASEEPQVEATLDGCQIATSGTFQLDLMSPSMNKPFFVALATLVTQPVPDGAASLSGSISGVIPVDWISTFCLAVSGMGVVNLRWLLNMAQICPDYDFDNDGQLDDGYVLDGTFEAVATGLFTPDLVPVQSLVTDCAPYEGECDE